MGFKKEKSGLWKISGQTNSLTSTLTFAPLVLLHPIITCHTFTPSNQLLAVKLKSVLRLSPSSNVNHNWEHLIRAPTQPTPLTPPLLSTESNAEMELCLGFQDTDS